jgi:hypothetical protein
MSTNKYIRVCPKCGSDRINYSNKQYAKCENCQMLLPKRIKIFKEDLEDKPQYEAQSYGNILKRARIKMLKIEGMHLDGKDYILSDTFGVFGYIFNRVVLVARSYVFGNIVSCHARAVASAKNQGKPLVMYIEEPDVFYEFNPDDILDNHVVNYRGGQKFLNFNIRSGRRFEC